MTDSAPIVVWFRRDLRLADNPALEAASSIGVPVIPLYVLDETAGVRPIGGASRWWLDKSLASLAARLSGLGSPLVLRRGASLATLTELVRQTGAQAVFRNRLYDAASIARDEAIEAALQGLGVECRSFNSALLNEPWEVASGAGSPYRVFTPYWSAARRSAGRVTPHAAPRSLTPPTRPVSSEHLDTWGLHPTSPDWSPGFADWRPGEEGAWTRLETFLDGVVDRYAEARDTLGAAATSRLSPHLAFGEIGPRQIWAAAQAAAHRRGSHKGFETFLKELGWREFNHHILFHQPTTVTRNAKPEFDGFPWRDDPRGLRSWKRGRTGFPIVDAAMRQLWCSGWMHNRARMIAASFLIKDLLIDWRVGETWFWDTLVDADLANNVGGWQWTAGSGADAAPYFRVFNPVLQGEKFDPDGAYVRRWLPELAALDDEFVHRPWEAPAPTLARAGVALGANYPAPVVDHFFARDRALDAFKTLTA